MRWRSLLPLIAVVLLAHALVLTQLPAAFDSVNPSSSAAPVFQTRTVEAPAPVAAAPAPSPAAVPTDTPPPAATPTPSPTSAEPADEGPPPVSGVEVDGTSVFVPAAVAASQPASPPPRPAPATTPPAPPAHASASAAAPAVTQAAASTPRAAQTAASASVPVAVRLRYDLRGTAKNLPYHADAELLWQHDGQHYQAQLEIKAFLIGSRRQTSEGDIGPQGLAPRRFADKARTEQAAHFHRDTQRVSFSANTPDAPLQPGAQDKLSLFLQLAALLQAQPQRWPVGSHLSLQVIGAKQAELWTFQVEGWDTLHLPQGDTRTLRLSKPPRSEFEPRVELWLAPSLQYLPVRIRLTQANGDLADQTLSGLDWLGTPPAAGH